MRTPSIPLCLPVAAFLLQCNVMLARENHPPDRTVSQTGTVSFKLHVDKTYRNGRKAPTVSQQLFELPGFAECVFRCNESSVLLFWWWAQNKHDRSFRIGLPELPGPATYFLQFSWDTARGRSDGYMNGISLRIPGTTFEPWWFERKATKASLSEAGPLRVTDLNVSDKYTPPVEAKAAVPDDLRGRHAGLHGFSLPPDPVDVAARRGDLLYSSLMDRPESVREWVAEGPLRTRYEGGHMLMRSANFANNIVFWCPRDFPADFVAEWEFKPLSEHGLAIVFFAARGEQGEDIFDPSLAPRNGDFGGYIHGDIVSYHISYFAHLPTYQTGRICSNMRKNNQFYKVAGGPVAVPPRSKGWQHIRLVKDGNHIQLSANGRISVDWTDDNPERYGPPHGGGKIGLRQMSPTIGSYRNFRVWALRDGSN